MSYKIPVVSGDNNSSHKPLADGDKLSPSGIPVSSESGNVVEVKGDGLFVPSTGGGGSGQDGKDGKDGKDGVSVTSVKITSEAFAVV